MSAPSRHSRRLGGEPATGYVPLFHTQPLTTTPENQPEPNSHTHFPTIQPPVTGRHVPVFIYRDLRYPPLLEGGSVVPYEEEDTVLDIGVANTAYFHQLFSESDRSIQSYQSYMSSSPPPHLSPASEAGPDTLAVESLVDIDLLEVQGHSTSDSLHTLERDYSPFHEHSPLPVQAPHSPAPQSNLAPLPGNGSLAQLRLRRIFSPVPATHSSSNGAAVYIGFPLSDHPTHRNFFEPAIPVSSRTPLLSDLLGALRSANTPVSQILNHVCAGLDGTPFHIAWSKLMLEVHEPGYCAVSNGYREIGLLRDHLHVSQVTVKPATHNNTSSVTFQLNNLGVETPLFVLYCFPAVVPVPVAPTVSLPHARTPAVRAQQSRSRSHTPAPPAVPMPSIADVLSSILKTSLALDQHFLADGFRLAELLDSNYGTAYLQIRQALLIESVYSRGRALIAQLTSHDVAAWAGIKPATYANNRTFVINARSTLQFLRHRAATDVAAQSSDVRRREEALKDFLSRCFSVDILTSEWDAADSPPESLKVGSAPVADLKARIEPYLAQDLKAYRAQRLETC
ncbi:hypothetical protein B0H14DRAFT_3564635 [Mycena olivaceomarginata]|nr:hypothetical protein B0H14DRAFT_3564635 [Mycena olivaceomarginata]